MKELCRNALKVEQAAKSRMRHLIREMSIHCRLPVSSSGYDSLTILYGVSFFIIMTFLVFNLFSICLQGPRVKFADPIEEIRILDCGKEDSGK